MDALGRATILMVEGRRLKMDSNAKEARRLALFLWVAFLKTLLEVAIPTRGWIFVPNLKKSFRYLLSIFLPATTHLKSFLRLSLWGFGSILGNYIVILARPLAILRLITFLPPVVLFLALKPCLFCLFNFLG